MGLGRRTQKPSADGFLKKRNSVVPSGLLSVSLRRASPSTWLFTPREGSVLRGLCGDSKQPPIQSKPTQSPQQANKSPTSAVVLPSLNSLSFCAAVIYSNTISLSSSNSPSSSSHHFPSPKLTEPPKAIRSDCLILRHRVRWLK